MWSIVKKVKESDEWKEEFDVALLLIFSVERFLTARKTYEAFHNGSTAGFEDSPQTLIALQKYLSGKKVQERLEKLINEGMR